MISRKLRRRLMLCAGLLLWLALQVSKADGFEMPEPFIADTATGLGAESGEIEFNITPAYVKGVDATTRSLALELEYVVSEGLGVEFELEYLTSEPGGGSRRSGLGDAEIAFQHTLWRGWNDQFFSYGVELGIPVGDEDKGFSEGEYELEPFITYTRSFRDTFFQISLRTEIELRSDEEDEEEEDEGRTVQYDLAIMQPVGEAVWSLELNGVAESGAHTLFLSPGYSVEVREGLGVGLALSLPLGNDDENDDVRVFSRFMLEF